jgi:GAF domain-containing protein
MDAAERSSDPAADAAEQGPPDVLEVLLAISRAGSLDQATEALLAAMQAGWPDVKAVTVLTLRRKALRYYTGYGAPPEAQTSSISEDGPLYQRLKSGVPISVADMRAAVVRDFGGKTLFPLLGRDRVIGAVVTNAPFSKVEHHHFLRKIAPHLGISLENVQRVRTATKKAKTAGQKAAQRVLKLTSTFGKATSLTTLTQQVLGKACEAVGAEKGSLMLLDERTDELEVRVVYGLPDKDMEERINLGEQKCMRLKRGQGVAGQVLQSGEPMFVQNTAKDKRFEKGGKTNAGTLLCVPLVVEARVIGVLNLTCKRAGADMERTVKLVGSVAEAAAIAIGRTRMYDSVVTDARTGLFVGAMTRAQLDIAVRRARESKTDVTVIRCRMGEASRFRGTVGSQLLLDLGHTLRRTMRSYLDLAGHLGDGNFLMVLPNTHGDGARVLARRLAGELSKHRDDDDQHAFGIAQLKPKETADDLVRRAEEALLQVRAHGPGAHIR